MARPFKLEIQESAEELAVRMRNSRIGQEKERLQMLWWVKTGQVTQHQELGELLGRHDATITRWLHKYRHGGLAALLEIKQAPGKPPIMSAEVQASLKAELAKESGFSSYGEIVDWLAREHDLVMAYATVYDWVHNRWGAELKVPRPQSAQQSPERVSDFKEKLGARLMALMGYLAPDQTLRYFCQDESRFGLKTLTGKVITARGVKPIVPVLWSRENFWLYGVIEPLTGQHLYQEYEHFDHQTFQQFIDQFAVWLKGDYAILQIDQARAHMTDKIRWPENVIPFPQPPHSPELNPIERVWQAIKRHLKGKLFATLDELRQKLQQVLDQMTREEIMNLSGYDFILEGLFYAASH